jgi:UPF0042 nucleotide-binding protein
VIKLRSFSYKDPFCTRHFGVGCVVLDCRKLPNPHSVQELRALDGRDAKVQQWMIDQGIEKVGVYVGHGLAQAQAGLKVSFGCHGGRHRSVAIAEMAAACLRDLGHQVEVEHTALTKEG